jgi:thymidine phosphorylase
MYLSQEMIQKKRDGERLDDAEIRTFVEAVSSGTVSDAQIAAFAMVVWFQGLELSEQSALTLAMRDSGQVLSWEHLNGPVLDKHSTGGVGDLVSLVLGPLVAACGGYVPMISGRGLGHTGGTLDKLESIPGFTTSLDVKQFQSMVQMNGVAINGQTQALAPADQRFYAVRDVTATVGSIPLIVASILSKKLSEGLDGLVMDVKFGSGAFMQEQQQAEQLAREISRVSRDSGLPCTGFITDMNVPLAWTAGNALEVREAVDFLTGRRRHSRLNDLITTLTGEMLVLGGINHDLAAAKLQAIRALDSGAAAEKFERMVVAQGGPADFVAQMDSYLPLALISKPVFPDQAGYAARFDMQKIGLAVVHLGGGRQRAGDTVDASVGLSEFCEAGQAVDSETPLAFIHAASELGWEHAATRVKSAIEVEPFEVEVAPVIFEAIREVENT